MSEKLKYFPDSSEPLGVTLAGITYKDSNYRIERMKSDVTVIEYVYSGEGFIEINGNAVRVCAGNVYMLRAGENHIYYSSPDNPWEKIFMNISGRLTFTFPKEFGLNAMGIYDGNGMFDIFERVRNIVKREVDDNDESELAGLFFEAVFRLSKRSTSRKHSADAVEMKHYLDLNIGRKVSNEELARHIFRSKDYCIKHFAAEYGVTPYDYQLSKKIEAACSILKSTAMPIAAVAETVGYNDPQYFSGIFRKKTGISPGKYRSGKK